MHSQREAALHVQSAKHVDDGGAAHGVSAAEGDVGEEAVGVVQKALE